MYICYPISYNRVILEQKFKTDKPKGLKDNFESLFNEFYPALCSFAQHYIDDKDKAEDIVQDVFIAFWKDHSESNQIGSIKAYLYTSVKNKCLNYLKHNVVVNKYVESEKKESISYFFDHVIEEETHRMIYNAIEELPPRCKEIVLLSLQGLKNNEIAEELNVSINTVKTQKALAYNELRVKLKHLVGIAPIIFNQLFN